MTKEKKFMGVRVTDEVRERIKKLADEEYGGNESIAVRIILQKFFFPKRQRKTNKNI